MRFLPTFLLRAMSPLLLRCPGAIGLAVLAAGLAFSPLSHAQQHRATRLGDPAHRFAPPLKQPEDLRRLLLDPAMRPDIEAILKQAKWTGNVDDLIQAARIQPIADIRLPKGTRMPFMSSRNDGKPVALIDVVWAGKEPVEAFAFKFVSKGRQCHLITPKPCSNFYVVDLGPAPAPSLHLEKFAPATVTLCAPVEFRYRVHNKGNAPATGVRVSEALPEGLLGKDGQPNIGCEIGDLAPGEARDCTQIIVASAAGSYSTKATATDVQQRTSAASVPLQVNAPVLALDCQAPPDLPVGRPFTVCLTARNTGTAPEPRAVVSLDLPPDVTLSGTTENGTISDGRVVWDLGELAPKSERKLCATFVRRDPDQIQFHAAARGSCARPVETTCSSKVSGIAAILLEVVDLADPIEVGGLVEYEIRVTNQGSGPLSNVKLACFIPESQEFSAGGGATPLRPEGRNAASDPLAVLAPKAEAVWKLTVKATTAGDARFRVDLTADQFQRAVEEWEATSQY